jgi:hypothetical protein
MDNKQIIELFQSRGLIDQSLGQDLLAEVDHSGKEIAEILADFQIIENRDDIWPIIASELGTSTVNLRGWTPSDALLELVPAGTARMHGVLRSVLMETASKSPWSIPLTRRPSRICDSHLGGKLPWSSLPII